MSLESLGVNPQEWERNNIALKREMQASVIVPMSCEAFKKTDEDRNALSIAKSEWREGMRKSGLSKRCGRINAKPAKQ